MNNYLNWSEKTIADFSSGNIDKMYADGFVFTRIGKGVMQQTRSVRIDLSKFSLTSENRRILKKAGEVGGDGALGQGLKMYSIPLPMTDYDFKIGKLAKDFYEKKFGAGIMSAQKVKELLTDGEKSNFNSYLRFSTQGNSELAIGYAICYSNTAIIHYSYPFYNLETAPKDMGLAMMTMAINEAKKIGLKYVYLGSLQRPTDTYKLQFEGLEWFDGKRWQTDIEEVKKILTSAKM